MGKYKAFQRQNFLKSAQRAESWQERAGAGGAACSHSSGGTRKHSWQVQHYPSFGLNKRVFDGDCKYHLGSHDKPQWGFFNPADESATASNGMICQTKIERI